MVNPLVNVADIQAKQLLQIYKTLGISPATRQKQDGNVLDWLSSLSTDELRNQSALLAERTGIDESTQDAEGFDQEHA